MYNVEAPTWKVSKENNSDLDPLSSCLIFLTKYYDKPCSLNALTAGLPLVNNQLDADTFVRAAKRAQLSARITTFDLKALHNKLLPAVVLLRDNKACIITDINENGVYEVVQPETGDGLLEFSLDELEANYGGYCIFTKPKYRFDKRARSTSPKASKGWFWRVVKRSFPVYSEVLVASFLINCFGLASPLFILNVYDRVVPNNAVETLWVLAIGATIVFTFDFLMKNLRAYFLNVAAKHIDVRLSSDIFERILGLEMGVRPDSIGSLAHSISAFDSFKNFMTSATITAIVDIPFTIIFLVVIAMLAGKVVLVPLIMIPIIIGGSLLIQAPQRKLIRDSFKHASEKQAVLFEALGSAETIKGVQAEGPLQRRWENIITTQAKQNIKVSLVSNLAANFLTYSTQIATVAAVIVAVYEISAGNISMGALIAGTILTGRALAPITKVAGVVAKYQQAKTGLESIDALMKLKTERSADHPFLHRPTINGGIQFKEVCFTYPNQSVRSLEKVSFTIKPGEKVGIIGRSGSGKSTLAKLILKLYPASEGSILLDGTELLQIDPADVRNHIAYVPQDVVLFHGSIKHNILAGAPHVDDETLLDAAKLAGVDDFTSAHPDGYDREVGERGNNLSGGQKQAIALARALLLDPPIYVFDEPTNAMDDSTTIQFTNRLRTVLPQKTLVLVTHKASLLNLVDRLIVLDNGKIITDGPKHEVLELLKSGELKGNRS